MFPDFVDSTMLSCFRECPQKFKRMYIENLTSIDEDSIDLIAGEALHAGLYRMRREHAAGNPHAEELGLMDLILAYGNREPGEGKRNKAIDRVIEAYASYLDTYPIANGKSKLLLSGTKPLVEVTFAIPTEVQHPETGDPILYAGRIDWLGEMAGGIYCFDEKTSSRHWPQQWSLRSQFLGYIYAAKTFGFDVRGCVVRGIVLKVTSIEHHETIVYSSDHKLNLWYEQLHRDLKRMVECYKTNWWDYNLGDECYSFGRACQFEVLCSSPTPDKWLSTFRRREWNPLEKLQK